nr:MAG TPA: hypothetical protein [Caudoviricetes sp.]
MLRVGRNADSLLIYRSRVATEAFQAHNLEFTSSILVTATTILIY